MSFCAYHVQLEKQTTIQATGVASGLVKTIQGLGFKLQTLNLSFDDEDVAAVAWTIEQHWTCCR
jgi:hypothetical protein